MNTVAAAHSKRKRAREDTFRYIAFCFFLFCRLQYVLVLLLVWQKFRCVSVGPSSGRVEVRYAETHGRTGSFGTLQDRGGVCVCVCVKGVYIGSVYGEASSSASRTLVNAVIEVLDPATE